MPTKAIDNSDALDTTSVPVGNSIETKLGGGVIEDGGVNVSEVVGDPMGMGNDKVGGMAEEPMLCELLVEGKTFEAFVAPLDAEERVTRLDDNVAVLKELGVG
jgi:hypothetical protein